MKREVGGSLVNFDELMTHLVAAGIFFPVVLMLENDADYFFRGLDGEGQGLSRLGEICAGALEFMLLIGVCLAGVFLLGYAFSLCGGMGAKMFGCLAASLCFVLFVIMMGVRNPLHKCPDPLSLRVGLCGAVFSSFALGLSAFTWAKLDERWSSDRQLYGAIGLISVAVAIVVVCGV